MLHTLEAVGDVHAHNKHAHRFKGAVHKIPDHIDTAVTLQKTDVGVKGLRIFFHCLMVFLPIGIYLMIRPARTGIIHLTV